MAVIPHEFLEMPGGEMRLRSRKAAWQASHFIRNLFLTHGFLNMEEEITKVTVEGALFRAILKHHIESRRAEFP
jgi:hypothetical protein